MLWQLELFESQQRTGPRQLKLGVAGANTWESWIKPKYRRWNFRMASRQIRSVSLLLSEAVTYHQFQGLSQLATRDSRRQQDVLRATFMLPACWSSLGTLHPKTHSTIPGEKEEERYFLIGFGWFISISHPRPSVTSLWVFTGNMSWCPSGSGKGSSSYRLHRVGESQITTTRNPGPTGKDLRLHTSPHY